MQMCPRILEFVSLRSLIAQSLPEMQATLQASCLCHNWLLSLILRRCNTGVVAIHASHAVDETVTIYTEVCCTSAAVLFCRKNLSKAQIQSNPAL